MDDAALRRLLERYGEAWERRDPDLILTCFTPDLEYAETPFAEPFRGHAALRAYWAESCANHQDVRFGLGEVFVHGGRGWAEWTCTYTRRSTGERVEYRGMFVLDLRDDRIARLLEYWNRTVDGHEG